MSDITPPSGTAETPAMTATLIQDELVKIESLIATAKRLVDQGRLIDLSALERRTGAVCDAALALPAADSRPLLPIMVTLIDSLDVLADSLTTQFGRLPKLESEPDAGVAANAYRRTHDSG